MPFIPAINCALAELVYNQEGETVENTLWCDKGTSIALADLTTLAEDLVQWWDTSMDTLTSSGTSLVLVRVRDMSTEAGARIEHTTGLPLVGLVATSGQPNNVTVTTTLLTNSGGRSFRGRNYFVGMPSTARNTANTVSTTWAASLRSAYLDLIDLLALDSWTLVVASRFSLGAPRESALLTPVTGIKVDRTTDSQRRRLPGRGD